MITCDTHALLFWALTPDRLPLRATQAMDSEPLGCCDIVLWEIALLASKGRISLPVSSQEFLSDLVAALKLRVLPINPEIAHLAQSGDFCHSDPADRLIGATALHYKARLITADQNLAKVPGLEILWS